MKIEIKNKEILKYLFWGLATTGINLGGYFFLTKYLGIRYLESSITAWLTATCFSYVANKYWVFQQTTNKTKCIWRENLLFYLSRLFSCGIDMMILYLFVGILGMPDTIIKLISNTIAVILNYAASKWIIFK